MQPSRPSGPNVLSHDARRCAGVVLLRLEDSALGELDNGGWETHAALEDLLYRNFNHLAELFQAYDSRRLKLLRLQNLLRSCSMGREYRVVPSDSSQWDSSPTRHQKRCMFWNLTSYLWPEHQKHPDFCSDFLGP